LGGVNPMITPLFRHLFSNEDVAKYGIKQPYRITNASYTPGEGLGMQSGVIKKWWLPNQPIVWGKEQKKDGK